MRFMRGFVVLMALLGAGGGAAQTADAPGPPREPRDVKVEQRATSAGVTVATSGQLKYETTRLDSPVHLMIDISRTAASARSHWTDVPELPTEVRGSQLTPGAARRVVELNRKAGYRIEERPQGLTVLIDAPGGMATAETPPLSKRPSAVLAVLPRMPEAAKPSDAPKASSAFKANEPMRAEWKPAVTMLATSTTAPSIIAPHLWPVHPAALARIVVAQAATTPAPAAPTAPTPTSPSGSKLITFEFKDADVINLLLILSAESGRNIVAGDDVKGKLSISLRNVTWEQALDTILQIKGLQKIDKGDVIRIVSTEQLAKERGAQARANNAQRNGSKLMSLDFRDADVINLLRILGKESGRNIVASEDVKGKVSVSLNDVTWEKALDTILDLRGLEKTDEGGVIRIVSKEQLQKELDVKSKAQKMQHEAEEAQHKAVEAQHKAVEAQRVVANNLRQEKLAEAEAQLRGPLEEEVIRLSYADPEDVAKTLQGILGIPAEGTQIAGTQGIAPPGPPNPELYPFAGLQQQQQARPQVVVSVSQDVLAKGLTIRANKATNSIFLRLYRRDLEKIKKLVRDYLDVPLPQVKIEARMEILDRTALEAIGIQWGGAGAGNVGNTTVVGQGFQSPAQVPGTGVVGVNPVNPNLGLGGLLPVSPINALPLGGNLVNLPISTLPNAGSLLPAGGIAFGIIGTNWNINLALQALATLGKTRTLARPEIVTVENNKAEISLGEEIPYATVSSAGTQIQFKDALLKLSTTPTVIRTRVDGRDETKIKLVVVVENNSRGDVVNLGSSGSPPAINKRKAETLVLLNEGERLVIGGVTTSTNQNTIRKVPYLGDIPFLGWAFKQREIFEQGREMVVFLTPSVLKGVAGPASSPK